ncbi:hypothetical protein GBA52_011735 [Prunus armeniaca]|nr:hypothetical protein GBA52_011735 [Prunus armeniaca]
MNTYSKSINQLQEPFNAEPPRSALVSSYVTPVDFFYKRNHGPIPVVDDIHSYSVYISGLIENPKHLFMKDIRALPKYNVTATLQLYGVVQNWLTFLNSSEYPKDVNAIKPGKVKITGYAASGGGRGIERVDVSVDGGKTWIEASRYQRTGIPYISEHTSSEKWAWVLFEATSDVQQSTEIVDSAANVQPEKVEDIWNLRGILNTSWHRVQSVICLEYFSFCWSSLSFGHASRL